MTGEYRCTNFSLAPYFTTAIQLVDSFENVSYMHVHRESNWEADELSQVVLGLRMLEELTHKSIFVYKKTHPSILERGLQFESFNNDLNVAGHWCTDIKSYLENPAKKVPCKVKAQSLNYVLIENELFRKTFDGLLLRCPSFSQTMEILKQVHEGVCGAH